MVVGKEVTLVVGDAVVVTEDPDITLLKLPVVFINPPNAVVDGVAHASKPACKVGAAVMFKVLPNIKLFSSNFTIPFTNDNLSTTKLLISHSIGLTSGN